jgi:hypothetical protein
LRRDVGAFHDESHPPSKPARFNPETT